MKQNRSMCSWPSWTETNIRADALAAMLRVQCCATTQPPSLECIIYAVGQRAERGSGARSNSNACALGHLAVAGYLVWFHLVQHSFIESVYCVLLLTILILIQQNPESDTFTRKAQPGLEVSKQHHLTIEIFTWPDVKRPKEQNAGWLATLLTIHWDVLK